jgi:hypothetical protein
MVNIFKDFVKEFLLKELMPKYIEHILESIMGEYTLMDY